MRRRNRARSEGVVPLVLGLCVPVLTGILMVPLVRPVFLSFLDFSQDEWPIGVEGVSFRAGLLVLSILALDVFSAVIRGEDRTVLQVHPVRPSSVVVAELLGVVRARWWLLPVMAVVLGPIAWEGSVPMWLACVGLLAGCMVLGLSGSAVVHLLAVEAAENPRMAPLLDLVRGNNPRPQAAFIWAPGVVLSGAGLLVMVGASGVPRAATGDPVGFMLVALPALCGVLVWPAVPWLAGRTWFRASVVLAEIRARYAALEDKDEALRVYLDWTVRFLPTTIARYALNDLRHGWRARRTWISVSWFMGLGALVAGWTEMPIGPGRAASVAGAGAWLCCAVGVLIAIDEPPFMRVWLPADTRQRLMARLFVLVGWCQCVVWPGVLAIAVRRRDLSEVLWTLGMAEAAVLAAAMVAITTGRLGARAINFYVSVGVLCAGGGAAYLMN